MRPALLLPSAAALLILAGCLDSPSHPYDVTARYFFRQADAHHVLFEETRFRKNCRDGACASYDTQGFYTRLVSMNKSGGETRVLDSADVNGIPAYFIFPNVYIQGPSADSVWRIDALTGARAAEPRRFDFLGDDSSSIAQSFLSSGGKYLVTRECRTSSCETVIYELPSGTEKKRIKNAYDPLALDEDSLILYSKVRMDGPVYYVSAYRVSSDSEQVSRLPGAYSATLHLHTGESVVLTLDGGVPLAFPTPKDSLFRAHLKDAADLAAGRDASWNFQIMPDSGEYVEVSGQEVFFGNLYDGARSSALRTYDQVPL